MTHVEKFKIIKEFAQDKKYSINWQYLTGGRGLRKVENMIQIILGRILIGIVILVEISVLFYEISRGYWLSRIISSEGSTALMFWLFALVGLYSLFLLRDRTSFLDKVRNWDLHKLKKCEFEGRVVNEIEITDFFSHKTLWIVDYCLNTSANSYLAEFLQKVLQSSKAQEMLSRIGVTREDLNINILHQITSKYTKTTILKSIIVDSFIFAYKNGLDFVDERALLYTIVEKFFADSLQKMGILKKDLEGIGLWIKNEALKNKYFKRWKGNISLKPKTTVNRAYTSRYTPMLNEYSRDFTNSVIQGDFTISIAREGELSKLVTMLEKGEKSAVLLVGEAGVGKTTLVKSLAVRMVVEDVPKKIQDMRLVGFDFNKAFTSSKNADEFKSKLRQVFEEVAKARNVVLVLDNINQMLNLRSEISGEIANIIVDAFDNQNIRMVATTDRSQYTRFIRPHKALAGMFSEVEMANPSNQVAIQIVFDEVPNIESDYNVKIAYSGVKASVELAPKYASDRVLPDRALNILKETVVNYKSLAGQKPIEYDEVAKVISSKIGVNLGSISQDEGEKLAKLEERMHKRVVGQNEAIDSVSGALRRSRSGLGDEGKPIASFLFFGPTGVGKTEVAKTVAEVYYGSEDRMVRLDMSEYNEEENLKRLIGHSTTKGAFEGGFLTEPIFQNPFSLVLLDEIDKANPKVLDLFLQVLDEGYLVDGLGRKIDFSNTIIIATSNAGSHVIAKLLEKGGRYKRVREKAMQELKKVFRIEFINRFSKVIMFKPLTKGEIKLVAKKFVEEVRLKLFEKGIKLIYDEKLLSRLADLGYSPVFGAREMKRVVQEEVENKVAEMIVGGDKRTGDRIYLV